MAGLTETELKAPALVELREMESPEGELVFFFNHGEKDAEVEFAEELERPAASVREIVTGEMRKAEGKRFVMRRKCRQRRCGFIGSIIKKTGRELREGNCERERVSRAIGGVLGEYGKHRWETSRRRRRRWRKQSQMAG